MIIRQMFGLAKNVFSVSAKVAAACFTFRGASTERLSSGSMRTCHRPSTAMIAPATPMTIAQEVT